MVLADLMREIGGEDQRSDAERRLVAVHEAGHAVVAALMPEIGALDTVSIRQGGATGGNVVTKGGPTVLTADLVHRRLVLFMAGRSAEEAILGQSSSGAGGDIDSDLGRATQLAVTASTALGLDSAGRLLWRGEPDAEKLPTMLALDGNLAARVQAALEAARQDALGLVLTHRLAVEAIADALMRRTTIGAGEVIRIVSGSVS